MSVLRLVYREQMQKVQKNFDAIVVGLGKTGMSCVRHLSSELSSLAVVDTRDNPPCLEILRKEFPQIPFFPGEYDQDLLCSAEMLVISPGVPLATLAISNAVDNGVTISGDIEIFLNKAQAPVVAVTGSNGKSTVAKLISEMISASGHKVLLGGNYGTPALALLESEVPDFYVLELSSFQLETIKHINALASTVLNISEDHMDRYETFEDYALAKQKIFMGNGTRVVNLDDPVVRTLVSDNADIVGFSIAEPTDGTFGVKQIDGSDWICFGKQKVLKAADIHIAGRHNISNSLAGLALGHAIGLELGDMANALRQFKGLPHRCESVMTIDDIEWINDSKATNPGATCAAIEGMAEGENLVLIAGGDAKGADFTSLSQAVDGRVHSAVLIGKDASKLEHAISEKCKIIHALTLEDAVITAQKLARPGDKVLMSPACASLDMFADYEERGEKFSSYVKQLADCGSTGR